MPVSLDYAEELLHAYKELYVALSKLILKVFFQNVQTGSCDFAVQNVVMVEVTPIQNVVFFGVNLYANIRCCFCNLNCIVVTLNSNNSSQVKVLTMCQRAHFKNSIVHFCLELQAEFPRASFPPQREHQKQEDVSVCKC